MKYLVVLCDGMADKPNAALQNKTPMEAAHKPHMDALAKVSEVGLCKTVADGLKPGSDVANLSVMGYDPMKCYTGCNLVTLSDEERYEDKTMVDYCGGDVSTAEAAELMKTVFFLIVSESF